MWCEGDARETSMPRVQMTKMKKVVLYLLQFYLIILLILLLVKFLRVVNG